MSTHTATYSPEDNKLRLYVGRVPRDEYEALRAEGWTSTPKQDCDFVATWTPARRDRALSYAEIIEDEDQGPAERAVDRAERFGGYREKRLDEATSHADNYEGQGQYHGAQSIGRAVRAADHHDRTGSKATDAWSKAEYWQHRTAGVIAHALYVFAPGVRMGRIKTLEAELRAMEARFIPADNQELMQEDKAGELVPHVWCGQGRGGYWVAKSLLPAIEAGCQEWMTHLKLRIAYENQMLEAQGGRLASVDIEVGGRIGGKLVMKVSKSPATGRVTSVALKGPAVTGWTYKAKNVPGTDYALYQFETERMAQNAYTAPTEESLAELKALKVAQKAAAPAKEACLLVNPTDKDAERLQALWNEEARQEQEARKKRNGWAPNAAESKVIRCTQAWYSAQSKGSYASVGTSGVYVGGTLETNGTRKEVTKYGVPVCQVRQTSGEPHRVIVLTDKPQKPLPVAVWQVKVATVEV